MFVLQDKEDRTSLTSHRSFTKLVPKEPGTSVKLISKRLPKPHINDLESPKESIPTDILIPPSESVKARLSSGKISVANTTDSIDSPTEERPKEVRPLSSYKLEKLSDQLKSCIKKVANDTNSSTLNDYCTDVLSSCHKSVIAVDRHKEDFESSKDESDKIVKEILEADEMQTKLLQTNFLDVPEKELDLVSKIWKEEITFQAQHKKIERNGEKKLEGNKEKEKLLAALKAIDKGEDVDEEEVGEIKDLGNKAGRRDELITNLFGDI